jgi:trk system potassium uptake protein TrkH
MNYRAIAHYVGNLLKAEAVLMLPSLIISMFEREFTVSFAFLKAIGVTLLLAAAQYPIKRGERNITTRDGFVLVALCWITLSAVGALPFWFSGRVSSFIDCLFESVSGFTTTGASVVPDAGLLGMGLLFWRALTQWVGGMGILLLLLAVFSTATGEHTINVMRAELPGPSKGKVVPSLRRSAKIIYFIYAGLTTAQLLFYLFGGMSLFDSVCHAMTSAGTGGFSVWQDSIGHYNSVYIEAVTTVFTFLFGVNFNIFYFIIIREFAAIRRNDELIAYLGITLASVALVCLNVYGSVFATFGEALRRSSFYVVTAVTTTGYMAGATENWPRFSQMILLCLMFIGACGGSTGGGLKVSRVVIAVKDVRRILFRMSHPRTVEAIEMNDKALDKQTVHGVSTYIVTYTLLLGASLLLVSIEGHSFITNLAAVAACINNVGVGFGEILPRHDFSEFSALTKAVLMFDMFVGRLEIYPMLLLLAPHTWRKI